MNGNLGNASLSVASTHPLTIPMPPLRGAVEQELERAKSRLLNQLLEEEAYAQLQKPLRHAANEAAALAWMTPFPLLLLPLLIQEKAQFAQQQARHQHEIYRRNLPRPVAA